MFRAFSSVQALPSVPTGFLGWRSLDKEVSVQFPFLFTFENDGSECQEVLETQHTADLVICQPWVFMARPSSN